MNTPAVSLLAAAMLIAGTQLWILRVQSETQPQLTDVDLERLPFELGPWSGESVDMDDRLTQKIAAVSTVSRHYQNDAGQEAYIHLAAYFSSSPTAPHHVTVCYPGAGWKIESDAWLETEGQQRCHLMQATQDGHRVLVGYWYQLGEDVAGTHDEVRQIMTQFRKERKRFPPIIKVMIHVPADLSERDARQTVESLSAEIYRWIKSNFGDERPQPTTPG